MKQTRLKCNVGEYGVIFHDNKVLILRLPENSEFKGENWMLPGGRLDETDQPEEGLKREIKEETGLDVEIISPCHTARWGNEEPPKYSVFYSCTANDSNVLISDEHIDYKWIKQSAIDEIPFHNKNSKIAIERAILLK
jgi:8-oxo-dGTP diphosphatase